MGDFVKAKRHIKLSDGTYKPVSYWSDSESVTMASGKTLEAEATDLKKVVSTTANGLAPKLSNNATQYLNGQGTWTSPTSGYVTEADEKLTIYTE